MARKRGLDALFLNVSFVGSEALLAELGDQASGVIVTQVVPPPDVDLPAVKAYVTALSGTKPTFGSLEGYLAAKAFAEGLRRAGPEPTREGFIDALDAARDFDIGLGQTHSLSRDEHQISHKVWPTIIRDGSFHSFKWRDLQQAKLTH